jgi:hypothetical protein
MRMQKKQTEAVAPHRIEGGEVSVIPS